MEAGGQAGGLENPVSPEDPRASMILGGERAWGGAFIPLDVSSLVCGPGIPSVRENLCLLSV